jgi:glycosyltransferase involved in cell wall biosynthesis
MPKVSAVIIAFNEEADIARALKSVRWCDEIVVVDSGSTDRTIEICKAYGCRVLHREFAGYGEQKAFAVKHATNDWVFVVDADEEVSPALQHEILTSLDRAEDCHGFYIPITTVLWDQVIRTGKRHTKAKLRLFDRRYGNFGNMLVHESVSLEGRTERLQHLMYNYSYCSITDYFEKFNRYTSASARDGSHHGKRAGFGSAIIRLPLTFFQLYFLRGHLLDGSVGFVWSLFSSLYPTVKHLKLLELQRAVIPPRAAQSPDRELDRARVMRRTFPSNALAYALAAGLVGLAQFLMVLFDRHAPGNYSVLLLASIVASVWFWGFRPALAATALALLGLDYFTLSPRGAFTVPDTNGLMQLAIFAALSLLITLLIYKGRRQSFR